MFAQIHLSADDMITAIMEGLRGRDYRLLSFKPVHIVPSRDTAYGIAVTAKLMVQNECGTDVRFATTPVVEGEIHTFVLDYLERRGYNPRRDPDHFTVTVEGGYGIPR